MTYQECLDYIYRKFPNYQKVGYKAFNGKLDNIIMLCDFLKNPQNNIKTIHIAGSNGKGSTAHILASNFIESGYKTGVFSSPHLLDFRERIRINGQDISKEEVISFITKIHDFVEANNISFFEITTAMAFDYFSKEKVDVAIIETGLGGRLDATNVITPILSIITSISIDHTNFLGTTIESIATEKGGIIKDNTPVVIANLPEKATSVLIDIAKSKHSKVFDVNDYPCDFTSDLKGDFQQLNINTAYATINALNHLFLFKNIEKAFNQVTLNTNFGGRLQKVKHHPDYIVDIGHNEEAIKLITSTLNKLNYQQIYMVIGFVEDKELENIIPLFNKASNYHYFITQSDNARAITYQKLSTIFSKNNITHQALPTINACIEKIKPLLHQNDLVFIGGSTFMVSNYLQNEVNS